MAQARFYGMMFGAAFSVLLRIGILGAYVAALIQFANWHAKHGGQTQPSAHITGRLTERELAVLRLLARGLTNADIAGNLHLSEGTVRNHVSTILAKLQVADRTQAAVIALQHGLGE